MRNPFPKAAMAALLIFPITPAAVPAAAQDSKAPAPKTVAAKTAPAKVSLANSY